MVFIIHCVYWVSKNCDTSSQNFFGMLWVVGENTVSKKCFHLFTVENQNFLFYSAYECLDKFPTFHKNINYLREAFKNKSWREEGGSGLQSIPIGC